MTPAGRNKKSGMITFQTANGPARGYLALPEAAKAPGVLVLHAWWGLNDFFKGVCDRLANGGFVALAPDLNNGTVLSTVQEAEEFQKDEARRGLAATVTAALDYLQQQRSLASPRIGVVAFSMGAWYAMGLASQKPDAIAAVVTFYGEGDVDPAKARAAFLGHYAKNDEWQPLENMLRMEQKLKQARRNVTFHVYPEAKHWFFEEDRPNDYEPESAKLAWERTLDFLHSHLSELWMSSR